MEFSWQEYWSGLPFPSPGNLPHLGIKPGYPALQAYSSLCKPLGKPEDILPVWENERKSESESECCSVMSDSLWPHRWEPARLLCPWNSAGKNTRVGCHYLLQGIFPSRGLNTGLPNCRPILYCLSPQGNPNYHILHNKSKRNTDNSWDETYLSSYSF